ncbi:MAG TPA: methyltransferase domain-containing protein [Terracidiphilus sp.]|nr:methyltransferase domain-containing protein [Terracidiphilus sp.]
MESDLLSLLCDPDSRYSFEQEGSTLRNVATGRVYPIREEIPLFVSSLTGPNFSAQSFYDRIAPFYDFFANVYGLLSQESDPRSSWFSLVNVQPGARVLDVGVGTGASVPFLPRDIDYFGIDISWNMLRRCRRRLQKLDRTGYLFQAEACHLPFRASVFDVVIHTLGIRTFGSPSRAIREMIWVARPGAQILVVDRTNNVKQSGDTQGQQAHSLAEWVPPEMEHIETHALGGGDYECLTFRVPLDSDSIETEPKP